LPRVLTMSDDKTPIGAEDSYSRAFSCFDETMGESVRADPLFVVGRGVLRPDPVQSARKTLGNAARGGKRDTQQPRHT
jgi:hypothetical protein